MKVEISCGYRIHINSIDMNGYNQRICGGIGFCVDEPRIKAVVSISHSKDIIPLYLHSILFPLVQEFRKREKIEIYYKLSFDDNIHQHKGLGSTTIVKLCILSALYRLAGKKLNKRLANLYKIGLISGISINAFFDGGFIVDGGYQINNTNRKTLNGITIGKPSPLLFRALFPSKWQIVLAIPKKIRSLSGKKETLFFNKITPIDNNEIYKIAYYVLMGAIPSLLEKNFTQFLESINEIVQLGTKKYEKTLHFKENQLLISRMEEDFGFSSVSSLGPAVYAITDKIIDKQFYKDTFKDHFLYFTKVSNNGHNLVYSLNVV